MSRLYCAAAAIVMVLFSPGASAQLLYDYLSRDVSADITRKDQLNTNFMLDRMLTQMLAQQVEMGRINLLMMKGQLRINEGRASTGYQPTEQSSIVSTVDANNRANSKRVLEAFAAALRDKKLRQNDVADCHALGIVMSYYGYWGEDPGPQRLLGLRDQFRKALLADLTFQGYTDAERQQYCERTAFLSMLSAGARNEALQMTDPQQRTALLRKAQSAASSASDHLFKPAVSSAELIPGGFGDRSARQAKDGSGSLTFRRSASSSPVETRNRYFGAGSGNQLLNNFHSWVRAFGGSPEHLPDIWATAYIRAFQIREKTAAEPSRQAWSAIRDYERKLGLANPGWLAASDQQRQEHADKVAIEVADMVAKVELNRQRLAAPRKADPVTGIVFYTPVDESGSLSAGAAQWLAGLFSAEERKHIDSILSQR